MDLLVSRHERGYAMAALLVGLSVMAIMLGMAMPAWRTFVQREREAELIFRGEQYAQAISLYSRRTGGFPTSFDALRDGRYIRKLYKDPITNGDFQPVYLGQAGSLTPPVVPGARGAAPGTRGTGAAPASAQPGQQPGALPGRAAQPGGAGASPFSTPQTGRAGQPGIAGQPGMTGQPGVGSIIGVVSRSTGESMRLYNGRNKYNEWQFVSTAATQQPGIPAGAGPPGIGGRGQQPGARGRGGAPPGMGPGRGQQPGGQSPFNQPIPPGGGRGGFPPSPFGRPGGPGTGAPPNPNQIIPGRQ